MMLCAHFSRSDRVMNCHTSRASVDKVMLTIRIQALNVSTTDTQRGCSLYEQCERRPRELPWPCAGLYMSSGLLCLAVIAYPRTNECCDKMLNTVFKHSLCNPFRLVYKVLTPYGSTYQHTRTQQHFLEKTPNMARLYFRLRQRKRMSLRAPVMSLEQLIPSLQVQSFLNGILYLSRKDVLFEGVCDRKLHGSINALRFLRVTISLMFAISARASFLACRKKCRQRLASSWPIATPQP